MIHTGKPAWPVERTLLVTGVLNAYFISNKGDRRIDTPWLDVRYQSAWDWHQPPPPPPQRFRAVALRSLMESPAAFRRSTRSWKFARSGWVNATSRKTGQFGEISPKVRDMRDGEFTPHECARSSRFESKLAATMLAFLYDPPPSPVRQEGETGVGIYVGWSLLTG